MLTKRQKQILNYIEKYSNKKGFAPSLKEMKVYFNLSSESTVHQHIETLRQKGYLKKDKNQPRGIYLSPPLREFVRVPLLGKIAAGQPIEAIQEEETVAVPREALPRSGNCYALQVIGNSMIDENINNGDIVLVKEQAIAENGEKVVALIDNYEATLKKYYKEKGQIRLQPANRNIEPIIIKKDRDIRIQGIFVGVIKNQIQETDDRTDGQKEVKARDVSIKDKSADKTKGKLVNKLNDLNASQWIPETVSVYVQRGLGAGHEEAKIERQHPAPYSFQDIGRLVRFFTKKGQRVLDPFLGVGSTLKACAIDGREGVGIELVKKYVDLSQERLKKEVQENLFGTVPQKIIHGDALEEIEEMSSDEFDFIVTSPPYWNILNKKADHKTKQERIANNLDTKYSTLKKDLGNIDDYEDFIDTLSGFFNSCSRILKPRRYMAVVVSDFRNKDRYHMFHSDLAARLEKGNFTLKGITILYQSHKKIFPYGYPYSYVPNIHHQYILILQNKKL